MIRIPTVRAVAALKDLSGLDWVCVAAILVAQGWGYLSALFIASLIGTRPVLLEMISAGVPAMISAGAFLREHLASAIVALLAPLPIWTVIDGVSWWGGRRLGIRIATVIVGSRPRAQRWLRRTEEIIDKHRRLAVGLGPLLVVPASLVYAAAGWRRLSLGQFLLAYWLGVLARTATLLLVGYYLGRPVLVTVRTISSIGVQITAGVVLIVAAAFFVRSRRRRKRPGEKADTGLAGQREHEDADHGERPSGVDDHE
jgi:membrane protein DedA with SNARE-associated domain